MAFQSPLGLFRLVSTRLIYSLHSVAPPWSVVGTFPQPIYSHGFFDALSNRLLCSSSASALEFTIPTALTAPAIPLRPTNIPNGQPTPHPPSQAQTTVKTPLLMFQHTSLRQIPLVYLLLPMPPEYRFLVYHPPKSLSKRNSRGSLLQYNKKTGLSAHSYGIAFGTRLITQTKGSRNERIIAHSSASFFTSVNGQI